MSDILSLPLETRDTLFPHADLQALKTRRFFGGEVREAIGAKRDVFAPMAHLDRELETGFSFAIDGERLVLAFPSIAVRADVDAGAPELIQPRNIRQFIDHTGGQQENA